MYKVLLFIVLCLFLTKVNAQQIPFQHFGFEDGLLDEKCYDIVQDKNGFIWLGTNSSLVRFDGTEFITYPINGRTDIDVYRIREYEGKLIFVTAEYGLYILDQDSMYQPPAFKRLHQNFLDKRRNYFRFSVDEDNNLWMGTYSDTDFLFLKFIGIDSVDYQYMPVATSKQKIYVKWFKNGEFSVAANRKPVSSNNILVDKGPGVEVLEIPIDNYLDTELVIKHIAISSMGTIAISFSNELFIKKGDKSMVIHFENLLQWGGLHFENDTTLWCATRKGETKRISITTKRKEGYEICNYAEINDATNYLKNEPNTLWITSGSEGINFCPSTKVRIDDKLKNVLDIVVHDGNLIGITQTGHIVNIEPEELDTLYQLNEPLERIFSTSKQLVILSLKNRTRFHFDNQIKTMYYQGSKRLVEDDLNYFISGSSSRKVKTEIEKETNYSYPSDFNELFQVEENLTYGRKGEELYRMRLDEEKPISSELVETAAKVFDLDVTQDGSVFYSTLDGGFYELNRDGTSKQLIKHHPLFKEEIIQITRVEDGFVILFSNCILKAKYEKGNYSFEYFFRIPKIYKGPFKKLQIHNGTYYWVSDGDLYSSKNPFESKEQYIYPTYLELDGTRLNDKEEINRSFSENSITLSSANFEFVKSPYTDQMVEIISQDSRLVEKVFGNKIFLPDLSAGKHIINTFNYNRITQVRSKNSSITVKISVPFWKEWWFWLVVSIFVLAPFLVFVLLKSRSKLVQERLSNQLNQMRAQAISAQLNPHFIFNALGSIQFLINEQQTDEANDYLTQFAKLLRIVLENSTLDWYAFSEERKILELYTSLENLRFKKSTTIEFINQTKLHESEFCVPPLFLQILVENAVIHGLQKVSYQGKILVRIEQLNAKQLQINVLDNGVGYSAHKFPNSKEKKSMGLSLIQQRLDTISKTEKVQCSVSHDSSSDSKEFATNIKIIIPVKRC